ncbi:uncharacterized protein [Montipora capricornis]|uniref:uncharacterized protein n=1 Tax=Montipora capricornis TaxID=246305 RepID=UPI0035F11FCA
MHSTVLAISMRLEYCIHISEVLLPMLQYHLLSSLIVSTLYFIFSNKQIIAVCHWSRENERSAPSREVPMTKEMITNLIENQGHNVKEIAHDCVMALKAWFQGKGIKNSFDTCHGTKGVARDMKKICSGTCRDEGIKWFTQLSDKAKATKTHFYWAMRNNDGTAAGFQQYLLNIVDHYQGKHDLCHQDSRCKHAGYICSKKKVFDPKAVDAYKTAIMKTTIYKNPSDYLLCRDTFYIESFHVVVLIYAHKRIHFGDDTYEMRVSLAILDWLQSGPCYTHSLLSLFSPAQHMLLKAF